MPGALRRRGVGAQCGDGGNAAKPTPARLRHGRSPPRLLRAHRDTARDGVRRSVIRWQGVDNEPPLKRAHSPSRCHLVPRNCGGDCTRERSRGNWAMRNQHNDVESTESLPPHRPIHRRDTLVRRRRCGAHSAVVDAGASRSCNRRAFRRPTRPIRMELHPAPHHKAPRKAAHQVGNRADRGRSQGGRANTSCGRYTRRPFADAHRRLVPARRGAQDAQ